MIDDLAATTAGASAFQTWLPDCTASSIVGADQHSSSDRRTSRLVCYVYQCYFANILHASRLLFLRIHQLYAVLEYAVEMETEMLSLRIVDSREQHTASSNYATKCHVSREPTAQFSA